MPKPAPSRTPKKTPAKKTAKKAAVKTAASPVRRKQTTKKKPISKKSVKKEQVALPTNMSQRAITKSLTYEAYFRKLALGATYTVAALCIFAGSTVALYSSFNPDATFQMASI